MTRYIPPRLRPTRADLRPGYVPAVARHAQAWVYNGVKYRSHDEARYAARLDLLIHAGQVRSWSKAPCFALVVAGCKVGRYTPDFEVYYSNGQRELVEVKGYPARDYRLRVALFRALYPHEVLQVVDGHGRPWVPPKRRKRAPAASPGRPGPRNAGPRDS